ncbi:DUF5011 domain-containing protein [Enterococcus faecalis]|nr:DUF5011 domain-containing protein [Enterococcus faecalis]
MFFIYNSVIQPKHQKEEKTIPSTEQREFMDSSDKSEITEKETTRKPRKQTVDDWLTEQESQEARPLDIPNSSLTENELRELAQVEKERVTILVPNSTNDTQRSDDVNLTNHDMNGSGNNQEETTENEVPLDPNPEPIPSPDPEPPLPEPTPNPLPEPEEPPVIHESTPVIVLKTNQVIINEGEDWDIRYYFEVEDERASSLSIDIPSTLLKPGNNEITITVTNNFGRSATATLSVYLNTPPSLIIEQEDIQLSIHEPADLHTFVQAFDSLGKDISQKVVVTGLVDFHKEGEYVITYSVEDEFQAQTEKEITIQIVNEPPVIMGEDVQIQLGEPVDPLEFAYVVDTEDDRDGYPITLTEENIIENTVKPFEIGEYHIIFGNVADRDGKVSEEKVLRVTVVDNTDSDETMLEKE